ncbi:MAG: DUF2480 family protein [Flavobacteriales bacterium]
MEEIENKVAKSGLITLDLEEQRPDWQIVGIDIAVALFEGLVLREKDFREFVAHHNWEAYRDKAVHIYCSADAIVPTWAYMLMATQLADVAVKTIFGSESELKLELWRDFICSIDLSEYQDQRVIVKGCSDEAISESIYVELSMLLTPVVKSLMFGEPCSTVPLFKRK